MTSEPRRVTIPDFATWKAEGRKIKGLTAYDYPTARIMDEAGVDFLLVGDSLGTVVQGWENTLKVTLDQMVYHTEMVARAAKQALVVGDLPFLSYHVSRRQAIKSAGRMLKETNCQGVKLEGGRRKAETIRALVEAEIPVMGHIGLTPQSVRRLGGFKVQREADELMTDAVAVAEAGAFSIVLECIPANLAARISERISIPTIGIGAGSACDGQILVIHDMVGLFDAFRPKFARRYAELGTALRDAVKQYVKDVDSGVFPNEKESFR